MGLNIFSVGSEESDPLVYWSFGIAVASLLWSVAWSWWVHRRSVVQDYWFREVVGPKTVEPILEFSNVWIARCSELRKCKDPKHAAIEFNEFGEEKDRLLAKIWVTKLLFSDVYEIACEELDGVEDELGDAVGRISSIAAGALTDPADFDDFCRNFQDAVLRTLRAIARARFLM